MSVDVFQLWSGKTQLKKPFFCRDFENDKIVLFIFHQKSIVFKINPKFMGLRGELGSPTLLIICSNVDVIFIHMCFMTCLVFGLDVSYLVAKIQYFGGSRRAGDCFHHYPPHLSNFSHLTRFTFNIQIFIYACLCIMYMFLWLKVIVKCMVLLSTKYGASVIVVKRNKVIFHLINI